METNAATNTSAGILQPAQQSQTSALANVNIDSFLKLLIAELSNQDPLNPTDNDDILQQISQIRSIESTTKLNETLDAVRLGQNLASASALIDRNVNALAEDGSEVSGRVDRVAIAGGVPKLIIDGRTVLLNNVREIVPLSDEVEAADSPQSSNPPSTPTTPAAPAQPTADLNGDGTVNLLDAYNVVTNWGQTGQAARVGDANGDGVIDIFDVNAVSAQWGTAGSAATP